MSKVKVESIIIDQSLYPRSNPSEMHIHRMIQAFNAGVALPPITIEAKTMRLVDGRHRLEMHKKLKLKTIECREKTYKNEADLFADAVRLNIGHGEPLDTYSVRNAVLRLTTYGYSKQAISEVVRLPISDLEKIERGYANDESGSPLALKGGLSHLRGQTLDKQQQEINRRYSGPKAVFFVRQLSGLLANDMFPRVGPFAGEMDDLCKLWHTVKAKQQSSSAA